MPHFARLEADIVREVAEFDGIAGRFHPDLVWVACPADCREGWRLVGGLLVAPDDYRALRVLAADGYGLISDQLDMQFRDVQDGRTRWRDHVAAVKARYPKPMT